MKCGHRVQLMAYGPLAGVVSSRLAIRPLFINGRLASIGLAVPVGGPLVYEMQITQPLYPRPTTERKISNVYGLQLWANLFYTGK